MASSEVFMVQKVKGAVAKLKQVMLQPFFKKNKNPIFTDEETL